MANWRENAEFIYGLIIVITVVVVFFQLQSWTGMMFAAAMSAVVGVVAALVGFAAFESEEAIQRWDKIGKKP